MDKPKIIIVVGPTSSGKTSLSIALAKKFNGEVISADSRQIYKGLDIGTGKVTKEEMNGVPHHLLDVVHPDETYSADDFKRDGEVALYEIFQKEKLPIIAGGTFFYVDILLGKITAPSVPPDKDLRNELEQKTTQELYKILLELDSTSAEKIDRNNPRRLVRAIEIAKAIGSVPEIEQEEKYNVLTLGIDIDKEILKTNIHKRLETRLKEGMIDEVRNLLNDGLSCERLAELGIEYKYISQFLRGDIDENEMKTQIETKSWQYAKRQMTWLKRDKTIQWVSPGDTEETLKLVKQFLEK